MIKSPFLVALGKTIRKKRQQTNRSQEALALDAGLDRTYLGGVERGERNVTILNLLKVSEALGVDPATLLQGAKEELR